MKTNLFGFQFPHDFSKEIKEIQSSGYNFEKDISGVNDNDADIRYKPAEYWKNKYLEILEKYNQLLSEHLAIVKDNKQNIF